jgi:hypothetical protein
MQISIRVGACVDVTSCTFVKGDVLACCVCAAELTPPRSIRPKTTTAVARRLIGNALGNNQVCFTCTCPRSCRADSLLVDSCLSVQDSLMPGGERRKGNSQAGRTWVVGCITVVLLVMVHLRALAPSWQHGSCTYRVCLPSHAAVIAGCTLCQSMHSSHAKCFDPAVALCCPGAGQGS